MRERRRELPGHEMTVLSDMTIERSGIIQPFIAIAERDSRGNSRGLSCCGYDLTLDQDLKIWPGEFRLASTREYFSMPDDVVGIIHDKSSLARMGLAVQNTVAEPGWRGYLTLEITNHNAPRPWWAPWRKYVSPISFKTGDAIAQIIFCRVDRPVAHPYRGKYQDQESGPQRVKPWPTSPRSVTEVMKKAAAGGDVA